MKNSRCLNLFGAILPILSLVALFSQSVLAMAPGSHSFDHHDTSSFDDQSGHFHHQANRMGVPAKHNGDSESQVQCVLPEDFIITADVKDIQDAATCDPSRKRTSKAEFQKHMASLVSATLATYFTTAATFPLETIKLRAQTQSNLKGNLYKGFGSHSVAICSSVGIGMGLYPVFRSYGFSEFSSGASSTLISSVVSNPLWVFSTKQSLAPDSNPYLIRHYAKELVKKPRQAFLGFTPGLFTIPAQAGYYVGYEGIYRYLEEQGVGGCSDPAKFMRNVLASASAKVLVAPMAYPFEVVRRVQQKNNMTSSEAITYVLNHHKEAHPYFGKSAAFYRGFWVSTIRGSIGTGAFMALNRLIYDGIKAEYLDDRD